ncbi:hypothetical protein MPSEU_000731600 [Mayamaea pseudoterrestris]|nr:hypothetical protein MPSEU_000731600 [Mayamaea pseudoterrestris]
MTFLALWLIVYNSGPAVLLVTTLSSFLEWPTINLPSPSLLLTVHLDILKVASSFPGKAAFKTCDY